MGFKCHHGACQTRTGYNLMQKLEEQTPGFIDTYKLWQFKHTLADIPSTPIITTPVSIDTPLKPVDTIDDILKRLKIHNPGSSDARQIASEFLKLIDDKPAMEKHATLWVGQRWSSRQFLKTSGPHGLTKKYQTSTKTLSSSLS